LAANSPALSQSSSNASEVAGFLQVANGALSQVTSLHQHADRGIEHHQFADDEYRFCAEHNHGAGLCIGYVEHV
jgi:hypothetical protein